MMNKKIVAMMLVPMLLIGAEAWGDQTRPEASGLIECETKATDQTCKKNIREGVDPKILKALDKLEELGRTVKDLQADLSLEKLETLVGDWTIRKGKLYYQQEKKQIRFRISFEKKINDGGTFADREEFVFADGWLTHRQQRGKREDRYEYTRPGQQSKDLMRIGKSPLPIPIGQKAEQILKNFEVSLIEANEKVDPAKIKTVHLKLVPRKGTKLAMSHTRLEFWLREADYWPICSQWENDSGDIFTADMSELKMNKKMRKKVFRLPTLPSGYELKKHPLPEEPAEEGKD